MITKIKRAILHICNVSSGTLINSDTELDATDGTVNDYITNHIERAINNPSITQGVFIEDSALKPVLLRYAHGGIDFVQLSQYISDQMFSEYSQTKNPIDFDMLVLNFTTNGVDYIGFLKLKGKSGYIHRVMQSNGAIYNELSGHNSILPFINQTIDECVFISLDDLKLTYISKEHIIDGERYNLIEEAVVGCKCEAMSSKDVMDNLKSQVRKTENSIENMIEINDLLINKAASKEDNTSFSYIELAEAIYSEPSQRGDFIEQAIKSRVIKDESDRFDIDDYIVSKLNEKIKIETDTGCEIRFPSHLFKNVDNGISIKTADNGSIQITITGVKEYKLK